MSQTLLFRNIGELLTLKGVAKKDGRRIDEGDLGIKKKQALLCQDGKIVWVGSEGKLPSRFASFIDQEVDLQAETVTPAFVECHTHSVFAGSRAQEFELRNQGLSYQEISKRGGGILSTMKKTRAATEAELLKSARAIETRFVRQGVATLEIKSGYALDFENEAKMLRVANRLKRARIVTTYLGAHALPPGAKDQRAYLEQLVNEDLPRIKAQGLSCRCDIFIEKGFFSRSEAKNYLIKAQSMGFGLCIHADQLSRTKATELAVELGARSADHAIELSDSDITKLAASQVVATLLPAADLYMKCKYPKARKIIDAGGIVALATDFNPGTSPTQDLALVGLLARLEMKMSLPEVISAYTYGAAKALGLEKQVGSLEPGKSCDFAVVGDHWSSLFYNVGDMKVTSTYREGRRI